MRRVASQRMAESAKAPRYPIAKAQIRVMTRGARHVLVARQPLVEKQDLAQVHLSGRRCFASRICNRRRVRHTQWSGGEAGALNAPANPHRGKQRYHALVHYLSTSRFLHCCDPRQSSETSQCRRSRAITTEDGLSMGSCPLRLRLGMLTECQAAGAPPVFCIGSGAEKLKGDSVSHGPGVGQEPKIFGSCFRAVDLLSAL